jgi:hypothetical protein
MAGSVTTYKKNKIFDGDGKVEEHVWTWTADDATGAIASKASDAVISGLILRGETNPGTTAPTALYDVTLTDASTEDVFGGELADRSATVTESETPLVGSAYNEAFVNSILTFNGSNNSANSAVGTFTLYVRKS